MFDRKIWGPGMLKGRSFCRNGATATGKGGVHSKIMYLVDTIFLTN